MGGSQPSQTTQTTKYELAPEQRELLDLAMPGVRSFAASTPTMYPGNTVADFTPAQLAGQAGALQSAGTQQGLAGAAAQDTTGLLGNIWDPANNPALQGAIDASVRPITENYQQVVKPGIRDEFQGSQPFGGTRKNLAQGQAANAYLRNVGDTANKVVQGAYDTNMNANLKALALLPQTQAAQTTPALTTSGVGDVQQAMAQQLLNQEVNRYNYAQLAPFLQSQEIMSMVNAIPGAGSTTTANLPQQSTLQKILGGGMTGASLGSLFGPIGSGIGAGGGALLGFLA